MNQAWRKHLPLALLILSLPMTAMARGGSGMGGGGDAATEMRVDEIRADLLKWIAALICVWLDGYALTSIEKLAIPTWARSGTSQWPPAPSRSPSGRAKGRQVAYTRFRLEFNPDCIEKIKRLAGR